MMDFTAGIIKRNETPENRAELIVFYEDEVKEILSRDSKSFITNAREYAKLNRVYHVPGLFKIDNYLCLCLINPEGDIVGLQKASHLNKMWCFNLKRGSDINILSTDFGKVFLCVDVDIYKPEVIRAAVLMGTEIIVSVQYINNNEYNMVLSGAWQEAQQNGIYIVNSNNIGASLIGPCNSAADSSGFLKRGEKPSNIYAQFSSSKLIEANKIFPVCESLNKELYIKYLKELEL